MTEEARLRKLSSRPPPLTSFLSALSAEKVPEPLAEASFTVIPFVRTCPDPVAESFDNVPPFADTEIPPEPEPVQLSPFTSPFESIFAFPLPEPFACLISTGPHSDGMAILIPPLPLAVREEMVLAQKEEEYIFPDPLADKLMESTLNPGWISTPTLFETERLLRASAGI